jgi:hypothetical protein
VRDGGREKKNAFRCRRKKRTKLVDKIKNIDAEKEKVSSALHEMAKY